jgi:hypothetical protein
MPASVKIAAFWDVAPRSLVYINRRCRERPYQTTQRYIPEGSHPQLLNVFQNVSRPTGKSIDGQKSGLWRNYENKLCSKSVIPFAFREAKDQM